MLDCLLIAHNETTFTTFRARVFFSAKGIVLCIQLNKIFERNKGRKRIASIVSITSINPRKMKNFKSNRMQKSLASITLDTNRWYKCA